MFRLILFLSVIIFTLFSCNNFKHKNDRTNPNIKEACISEALQKLKQHFYKLNFKIKDSICQSAYSTDSLKNVKKVHYNFESYIVVDENGIHYMLSRRNFKKHEDIDVYEDFIQETDLIKSPFIFINKGLNRFSISTMAQMNLNHLMSHEKKFKQILNNV